MTEARHEPLDISILYVEDEIITRTTIHRMLQMRYGTIYLAADGREGLDLFKRHCPDIVITDTRMPVMDGLRMCREIRSTHPEVPIIFTTANEDSDFIEETRQLGVTRNIIKPILLKELLAALEDVVRGMAGRRPSTDTV